MTQEERDSGIRSVSHRGSTPLTEQLCWCVMAMIRWQMGADKAVDNRMVQALEQWLHRQGISIYTDRIQL
jgi:hypothetical protein